LQNFLVLSRKKKSTNWYHDDPRMWFPKRPINGTVAKLWLRKHNVPPCVSWRELKDPEMKSYRRGGKEKQLKTDAHQKNSKVEMSLEWSQMLIKLKCSCLVPQCPQTTVRKYLRRNAFLRVRSLALCFIWTHINSICFQLMFI
jgi:hypothetical protein